MTVFPPVQDLTYEAALQELEQIVATLEADGEQTSALDQALVLFARGQELARYCAQLLDQAELKVQQIAGEELVAFKS